MVLVGVEGRIVGTEALVTGVIVLIDLVPRPSVTLDAEMVVGPASQVASPGTRLQHALCQCDAGWDVISQHLLNGHILVSVEIVLIALIPHRTLRRGSKNGEKQTKKKKYISSHVFLCSIILQK